MRKGSYVLFVLLAAAGFVLLGQGKAWSAVLKVGADWFDTSYSTIQEAVDAAADGDEIWVEQGTYIPAATINISKAISLYGGFTGIETVRTQRNYTSHATIIDGNNSLRCFLVYSTITIDGFTITRGYSATSGGGIWNGKSLTNFPSAVMGNLTLSNCTLSSNSAGSSAGALFGDYGYLTITNCTFAGNTVATGKASCILNYGHDMAVTGCTFSGNSSNNATVSYPNTAGTPSATNHTTFTNCVFTGNTVNQDGAAIICDGNTAITGCKFINNTGNRYGTVAFYGDNGFTHTFTNCLFAGNKQKNGSAICINGSASNFGGMTAVNCTFTGNTLQTSGAGSVLYIRRSSLASGKDFSIINSIIYGNAVNAIDRSAGTNPLPAVSYSDLDQTGYAGTLTNSISSDPQFIGSGDYHLHSGSPCIDSGTSTGAPSTDIAGIARPQGSGYDMGTYEFLTDTDGDGIPDATDNCPSVYNPNQHDANGNNVGDCCDASPGCGGCGQPACDTVCSK